jgi:HEPN domain-containing protein
MNGPPKRPVETPREWLRYAEEDLSVAEREIQDGTPAYHTICFLCQSAAEKYLKGYLIAQGWALEKTHDIAALLQACVEYGADWTALAADGAVLNEYIVAGRYPGDIVFEEIGSAEATEALAAVRRIRERVRVLMPAV